MSMTKYSAKITGQKGMMSAIYFLVPLAIFKFLDFYPEAGTITVGALLTAFANWMKHRKD